MEQIKAIETQYKGYRFRSRLEARWAVFFDSMGINYEYEPEGFSLSNASNYLPDFFLEECETYVEIKPANAFTFKMEDGKFNVIDNKENADKYMAFASESTKQWNYLILMGDPVDVFTRNHGGNGHGVLFFSAECIFKGEDQETDHGNCKECNHSEMIAADLGGFVEGKPLIASDMDDVKFIPIHKTISMFLKTEDDIYFVECEKEKAYKDLEKTLQSAYNARQARFEFGEKG